MIFAVVGTLAMIGLEIFLLAKPGSVTVATYTIQNNVFDGMQPTIESVYDDHNDL